MRLLLPFSLSLSLLVVSLVALGGCSAPESTLTCPETGTWARVQAVEGTSLRVTLIDSSTAVLHVADSQFHYVVAETECYDAGLEQVRAGQEIEVDVDAWAESYPPQAWPRHVVIRG